MSATPTTLSPHPASTVTSCKRLPQLQQGPDLRNHMFCDCCATGVKRAAHGIVLELAAQVLHERPRLHACNACHQPRLCSSRMMGLNTASTPWFQVEIAVALAWTTILDASSTASVSAAPACPGSNSSPCRAAVVSAVARDMPLCSTSSQHVKGLPHCASAFAQHKRYGGKPRGQCSVGPRVDCSSGTEHMLTA